MASEDAARLTAVMAEVQADAAERPTVHAIIEHARELVPDASLVSITVRAKRGRHETVGSNSPTAEHLDRLQYQLAEGPCIEAASDADWFRSGDIGTDRRWPRWGPLVAQDGVHSVLSIRLLARGDRIGALNMYSETRSAFGSREDVDLAILYAVHVSYALASARHVTGLEAAMESRHTIGLAQGMLMERYDLNAAGAFSLLQRTASTHNRKVKDIAAALVETGLFDQ